MARHRRLLFRLDDELVLCTGPRAAPFVTITARGMGAVGAHRPLIVWDDIEDFEIAAGLPRSRVRRAQGIARTVLAHGAATSGAPDADTFPDRVVATWVFTRRQEIKEAGFGYVPRGVDADSLVHALNLVRAVARASSADERLAVIASVPQR